MHNLCINSTSVRRGRANRSLDPEAFIYVVKYESV
jgi:hypothetical protein